MTRTGLMRPQSANVSENEWDAAVAAFRADGADTGYSPLHRNTAIAAQSLRSSLSGQAGRGQRGSFDGGGGFGGGRRTSETENTEAQTKAPARNTELAVQSLRKALRQALEGEAAQPDKQTLRLFQAGFDADAASYNPKRVAAQVDALTRRETQQARLAELTQQYSQLYRHGQQQEAESLAPAIRQLQTALAQSDRRTFLQKAADGIKKAGNSLGDIADSFISVGGTRTLADILSLGGTLDEFLSLPIGTKGEEDYVSPLRQDAEELRSAAELELTQNLEDEPPLVRLACELAAGGGSDTLAAMMMTPLTEPILAGVKDAKRAINSIRGRSDLAFQAQNAIDDGYTMAASAAKKTAKGVPNVPWQNADNAILDRNGKLVHYALDVNHPKGGGKAIVFRETLGYTPEYADDLADQILDNLPFYKAEFEFNDKSGTHFVVDMPIKGPNGKTKIVRTAWMFDIGSDTPRLITTYVK